MKPSQVLALRQTDVLYESLSCAIECMDRARRHADGLGPGLHKKVNTAHMRLVRFIMSLDLYTPLLATQSTPKKTPKNR